MPEGTLTIPLDQIEPPVEWKLQCFLAALINAGQAPLTNARGSACADDACHRIEDDVLTLRTDWLDETQTQSWTWPQAEAQLEADAKLRAWYDLLLGPTVEALGNELLIEAAQLKLQDLGVSAECAARPDHRGNIELYVPTEQEGLVDVAGIVAETRSARCREAFRGRRAMGFLPRRRDPQREAEQLKAELADQRQRFETLLQRLEATAVPGLVVEDLKGGPAGEVGT